MQECDSFTSASSCQCTQPDSDNKDDRAQFWKEFEQVLDLQKQRVAGGMAEDVIDLPELFRGMTMQEAAEAVRADFPTEWPTKLAKQFLKGGCEIEPTIFTDRGTASSERSLSLPPSLPLSRSDPSHTLCK